MKPSYFAVVIALAAIFSIGSCSKEELTPTPGGSFPTDPSPGSNAFELTAAKWNQVASGVYTCPLPNIIPSRYANHGIVKIYLLLPHETKLINAPIDYLGGQLSGTASGVNISLTYLRSDNLPLPFSYLNIRVVIE